THRLDDPRRPLRADAGVWSLAPIRGPEDLQPAPSGLPVGALTVTEKHDIVTGASPDIVIVGGGPVGLTLANILGLQGVRTLVVDERDSLIDYPRGVGLDDEAL